MSTIAKNSLHGAEPLLHQELIPDLDHCVGGYRVRFAHTRDDLYAVQRLRFEVFNLELGEGLEEAYALLRDEDEFDEQCQHLMVIEKKTDMVVGTYRLQVAESAQRGLGFYSATEFDLEGMPRGMREQAMELGRACVLDTHRESKALFLLWKGLAHYALHNRKRYFFGCSSLTSQDTDLGLRTASWLREKGHVVQDFCVLPLRALECRPTCANWHEGDVDIPKLFGIYLRHGARICGPPAIDRCFGTIDFLILVDLAEVDPKTFRAFSG